MWRFGVSDNKVDLASEVVRRFLGRPKMASFGNVSGAFGLLFFASWLCCAGAQGDYPSNEYIYSLNRDSLIQAERKFQQKDSNLTFDEQTVDHFLQYLKWREFRATEESGFPPSRPIEQQLAYIQTTEIYNVLLKFPKGGNMHGHENHDTSKRILLDIVWDSPDFEHLYMLPPPHPRAWTLDFFINPPADNPAWIRVSTHNYTKEQILKQQTLLGILSVNASNYPTDSGIRWKEINPLWGRGSTQLIANINIKTKYLLAMYDVGFKQGIIYFETRKNLGKAERIYSLDPSGNSNATNGKHFLDEYGDLDVEIAQELSRNFSAIHPEFVGHNRISYTSRGNGFEEYEYEMQNVVNLYRKYPYHILGFDMVGEEDAGYSHLHYIDEMIKLYDNVTRQSTVPVYLHTSETNWPDDLMTSTRDDDLVATLMNNYETILLNSKRIGHGYGFIKHPYLLTLVRDRNIAVETCVVSNQILGFSPDIRNHPGLNNYRYGIPIVFGSDDAGTFGYDNITVDWYEAFMAWGLELRDLRTIALNSLTYSGLSEANKTDAIENKWKPMWNSFIGDTKAVACARDYAGEAASENRAVTFVRILPKEGARIGSTRVHVFGRNFEVGICRNVTCRFGTRISPAAVYVSNQHILCDSPDYGDQLERSVQVFVTLDGTSFVSTGFNFTYKFDPISPPEATTSIIDTSSDGVRSRLNLGLLLFVTLSVIGILRI